MPNLDKLGICHLVIELVTESEYVCKLFISQYGGVPPSESFEVFHMQDFIVYEAFCDDFGPMNVLSIMHFVERLDQEIALAAPQSLVCSVDNGRRALTNAAFLIGAYMILKLEMEPKSVLKCFGELHDAHFEPYRDASYTVPDFGLRLIDCWRGLRRAQSLGWFTAPSSSCPGWSQWGQIFKDEYAHFDDPFNADLHEVVPGKFVAFKGPKDLGRLKYLNTEQGVRDFSPEYYADILRVLGVSTVVRLNEAQYDAKVFEGCGLQHFDLYFEDCTCPSVDLMARFFRIADEAPGLVAVHCKSGIGRTGVLIGLYMMRSLGFTAREAMGWLRIMRPGSVIGPQQQFLCTVERTGRRLNAEASASAAAAASAAALSTASQGKSEAAAPPPPRTPKGCLRRPSIEFVSNSRPAAAAPAHKAAADGHGADIDLAARRPTIRLRA